MSMCRFFSCVVGRGCLLFIILPVSPNHHSKVRPIVFLLSEKPKLFFPMGQSQPTLIYIHLSLLSHPLSSSIPRWLALVLAGCVTGYLGYWDWLKKKKKSCGFWGVDVNWSEKKLTFEIQWTFPCPWHVNNDLLIEAAFSKMKNNLRFMDKSVQKDPALLGAKVETMSGDS